MSRDIVGFRSYFRGKRPEDLVPAATSILTEKFGFSFIRDSKGETSIQIVNPPIPKRSFSSIRQLRSLFSDSCNEFDLEITPPKRFIKKIPLSLTWGRIPYAIKGPYSQYPWSEMSLWLAFMREFCENRPEDPNEFIEYAFNLEHSQSDLELAKEGLEYWLFLVDVWKALLINLKPVVGNFAFPHDEEMTESDLESKALPSPSKAVFLGKDYLTKFKIDKILRIPEHVRKKKIDKLEWKAEAIDTDGVLLYQVAGGPGELPLGNIYGVWEILGKSKL